MLADAPFVLNHHVVVLCMTVSQSQKTVILLQTNCAHRLHYHLLLIQLAADFII
jgi:hypothetical protein